MGTPLEEALGGEPVSEEVTEKPIEEQQAAPEPEPEAKADETPQEEPEPSDEEPKGWQYAAYKDEKTKRQELEASLREQEQKFAEIQRQNAELQQFYQQQQALAQQQQDPQGAQVQELVGLQVGQVEAKMRLNTSRMLNSQLHGADKVQAAEKAFHDLARTNPVEYQALIAQYGVHEDPIGQIMTWHKRFDMLQQMGDDPQAYIEAQAEAKAKEMLAQMQQIPDPKQQNATPQVMPTDLSQTRNVGSRSGSNWGGPTDLSNALGER